MAAAVDAATAAWPELPVVTVGTSLGGVAVLRHAGLVGGVAGTVALSAPAWKDLDGREGARRLNRFVESRAGRQAAARLLRTRVGPLPPFTDMSDAVASIAPAFTLLVHDPDELMEAHVVFACEKYRHSAEVTLTTTSDAGIADRWTWNVAATTRSTPPISLSAASWC